MKSLNQNNKRAVFATRFGAIATTVGSAVGLGNIWRFPYEAGIHGGGSFILIYLILVLLIGVPLLIAEFAMGRGTRSNIFGAYRKLRPGQNWHFAGYLGIFASLLILSFYCVVAGWTIEYCLFSLFGQLDFSSRNVGHNQFVELTSGWRPLLWTLIFLILNFVVLVRGVTKGIEKMSNILMPLLFLLLLAFCINSFSMPGLKEGLHFMFYPDFSAINSSVILGALGQAFFSLSLGLGCMMTYGSYFNNENRLGRTAMTTALLDSLIAIISGVIIFPTVFSFGLSPEAGPTLVFEALPYIFTRLPWGGVWATLFFLLLFLASLTSTVSISEISISYLCEEKHMRRIKATIISSLIALVGALLCALSFGSLSNFKIFGLTLFDLFDYVSSNICLPLGGMILSIFVGWVIKRKFIDDQLTDYGKFRFRMMPLLVFALRWICPAAILLVFLNSIGIL